MKKTFRFSVPIDPQLVVKILTLLYGEDGITFLVLARKLKLDLNKQVNWKKLRGHLIYLEKEKLIEERHFEDKTVDYSLENAGIIYVRNLKDNP